MTTIHDVAAKAGVSAATVSRVISRPAKVAEATRRHVWSVIEQLNFTPTAAATSLRTRITKKILVTVPDIANPFFSLIIQEIQEAALSHGYSVVLGDTNHDTELEDLYAQMLLRREVDGLIFLGHRIPASLADRAHLRNSYAPVVNGCEYSSHLKVPSAHIDNAAAAAEAMNHLFDLGHRHIGAITGPLASPLSRDRLRGVIDIARARGVHDQTPVVNGDFSIGSGVDAAKRLLNLRPRPTAIFCFNDEMAIGVLDHAHRINLRVPQDLSVVGFDDIRFSRYVRPALTTISQPMVQVGQQTVRLLLEILQGSLTKPVSVTLPHQLVVRESTGVVHGS